MWRLSRRRLRISTFQSRTSIYPNQKLLVVFISRYILRKQKLSTYAGDSSRGSAGWMDRLLPILPGTAERS